MWFDTRGIRLSNLLLVRPVQAGLFFRLLRSSRPRRIRAFHPTMSDTITTRTYSADAKSRDLPRVAGDDTAPGTPGIGSPPQLRAVARQRGTTVTRERLPASGATSPARLADVASVRHRGLRQARIARPVASFDCIRVAGREAPHQDNPRSTSTRSCRRSTSLPARYNTTSADCSPTRRSAAPSSPRSGRH